MIIRHNIISTAIRGKRDGRIGNQENMAESQSQSNPTAGPFCRLCQKPVPRPRSDKQIKPEKDELIKPISAINRTFETNQPNPSSGPFCSHCHKPVPRPRLGKDAHPEGLVTGACIPQTENISTLQSFEQCDLSFSRQLDQSSQDVSAAKTGSEGDGRVSCRVKEREQSDYSNSQEPTSSQKSQDFSPIRNETSDYEADATKDSYADVVNYTTNDFSQEDHLLGDQNLETLVSTSTHYYGGSVFEYHVSNSKNVAMYIGDQSIKGCLSNDTLNTRIQRLRDVFVEVHALEKVKKLLKTYGHVTISGAPGDGKTSIALMLCDAYRCRNYQTLFVENIDELDIDVLDKAKSKLLLVFDDIFGSITFSTNMEKLQKVFRSLLDIMLDTNKDKRNRSSKEHVEDTTKDQKNARSEPRLRVIFTSRTYNLNEGRSQLFAYKSSFFRQETIINLTEEKLTPEEKKKLVLSFQMWTKVCDISQQEIRAISELQNDMFGFPFICKLYFTTSAFQHQRVKFFQNPLIYLRGNLDEIVWKRNNKSAAIIMLILCGGKLDLNDFKRGINGNTENMFLAVKQMIPSCTKLNIETEINNFNGSYCTLEQQKASFAHPVIYDAAACAFGKLDITSLLNYCSRRFLFERVRKHDSTRSPEPDDITNMIYIDESLSRLVVSRLLDFIKNGYFNMTINHPVLNDDDISSMMLKELKAVLPIIIHQKDKDTEKCFLYWTTQSGRLALFKLTIGIFGKEWSKVEDLKTSKLRRLKDPFGKKMAKASMILDELQEALVSSIHNGKLYVVENISTLLHQMNHQYINTKTKENKSLIMTAAEGGHSSVFHFLIQKGGDADLTDDNGKNCLHFSSESGSKQITKVILERNPHMINVADYSGRTPVLICAEKGHIQLLQFLVSKGADLRITDDKGNTILHTACVKGHFPVVKYVLSPSRLFLNRRGGIINETPVIMAAREGHLDVYNLLVSEGADLSLTDKHNADCLMVACLGGNVSIVKHLLSLNTFDVNVTGGNDEQTPVMMAARRGQYDVYKLLVSKGVDLSLTDKHNRDCLMLACQGGSKSIVKDLLSMKTFKINKRGGFFNQTPVLMAVEAGHYDVYNLLVSKGADLSLTDKENSDCLMLACDGGNVSIVKDLLSLKRFDINRRGGVNKETPLLMAAKRGHYNVYNLLVSEGADLSLTDEYETDCLMLACEGGDVAFVKHLLSLKIFNINRRGGIDVKTAIMVAAEEGYYDIYNLLVSEGADLLLTDDDNTDCLMLACQGGNVSIVKHLLSLKTSSINRRGGYLNQTPLMMAATDGHYNVYNHLVSEGADLSLVDKENRDCLMLACQGGNVSIVKHLLSLKTFDINRRAENDKKTPLMVSAEKGYHDVYNLLVSDGADLSLIDGDNTDCLMLACEGGNVYIVKHLLSMKTFDINRKGGLDNKTPLTIAKEKGHLDVYNLLVFERDRL